MADDAARLGAGSVAEGDVHDKPKSAKGRQETDAGARGLTGDAGGNTTDQRTQAGGEASEYTEAGNHRGLTCVLRVLSHRLRE